MRVTILLVVTLLCFLCVAALAEDRQVEDKAASFVERHHRRAAPRPAPRPAARPAPRPAARPAPQRAAPRPAPHRAAGRPVARRAAPHRAAPHRAARRPAGRHPRARRGRARRNVHRPAHKRPHKAKKAHKAVHKPAHKAKKAHKAVHKAKKAPKPAHNVTKAPKVNKTAAPKPFNRGDAPQRPYERKYPAEIAFGRRARQSDEDDYAAKHDIAQLQKLRQKQHDARIAAKQAMYNKLAHLEDNNIMTKLGKSEAYADKEEVSNYKKLYIDTIKSQAQKVSEHLDKNGIYAQTHVKPHFIGKPYYMPRTDNSVDWMPNADLFDKMVPTNRDKQAEKLVLTADANNEEMKELLDVFPHPLPDPAIAFKVDRPAIDWEGLDLSTF